MMRLNPKHCELQHLRDEGRCGSFMIPEEFLFSSHVRAAMGQCVIVKAEPNFLKGSIEYDAYCPDFLPQDVMSCQTFYHLILQSDGKCRWIPAENCRQPFPSDWTVFTV